MTLSERRALAVKNYILKNFPNIQPARFQTIGRGVDEPGRAEHDRGRAAAEPPHRHQGRPGRAVSAMARRPDRATCSRSARPLPRIDGASLLGLVMPALVLGAWCVVTYGGLAPPDFLPSPSEVVRGTLQLFIEHDLGERHPRLDAAHRASRSCSPRRWRCRSAC